MMKFRLAALATPEVNTDVLAAWELAAYFLGEFHPEELPLDVDEAREWYINHIVDEQYRGDYREEPQMADDEMIENFTASLISSAKTRAEALGDHYPFVIDISGRLVRKEMVNVTHVSASYLGLQFFRAATARTVEIDGPNDTAIKECKEEFDREFRKLFEYIAAYTVAGRKSGAAYMTSDCRSSSRLNTLLTSICNKVGSGKVLTYDQWNKTQISANDGGIDCLVHVGGPNMPGDAHLLLVGATVQKANIETKILGSDKVSFFTTFFTQQPAAFQSALVRPLDEDELTIDKCRQRNCLLFTYEQVWRSMGTRTGGNYQLQSLTRLDAKARKILRKMAKVVFLHDYEEYHVDIAA